VDDLYVDEDVCPWSVGVCVCVWDGILVVTCGALSANLRVITENGKGKKCVLRVRHFLAREWHVPFFQSFSSFLVFAFYAPTEMISKCFGGRTKGGRSTY